MFLHIYNLVIFVAPSAHTSSPQLFLCVQLFMFHIYPCPYIVLHATTFHIHVLELVQLESLPSFQLMQLGVEHFHFVEVNQNMILLNDILKSCYQLKTRFKQRYMCETM